MHILGEATMDVTQLYYCIHNRHIHSYLQCVVTVVMPVRGDVITVAKDVVFKKLFLKEDK